MKFFNTLVAIYKESKRKSRAKKEYRQLLLYSVIDGKLSKGEIEQLDKKKNEFGLTEDDIRKIRVDAYLAAFEVAKADKKVSKEEAEELASIQKYLGIGEMEIESTKKELARLRLLGEIQEGNLPTTTVVNLVTLRDELVYWTEPAILAEEKVINRRYEGGSSGVSFRIAKGVSYRVGGHRGHFISETGIVPVSNGELVLTSKRVIFKGDNKSFATKLDQILNLQLFSNGFCFSENNKSKPRRIKFVQEGNHDIIGAILSYAINHYSAK